MKLNSQSNLPLKKGLKFLEENQIYKLNNQKGKAKAPKILKKGEHHYYNFQDIALLGFEVVFDQVFQRTQVY